MGSGLPHGAAGDPRFDKSFPDPGPLRLDEVEPVPVVVVADSPRAIADAEREARVNFRVGFGTVALLLLPVWGGIAHGMVDLFLWGWRWL